VEIQELIDANDSYPGAAVRLVAERARSLADADGTAIGILKSVHVADTGETSTIKQSEEPHVASTRTTGVWMLTRVWDVGIAAVVLIAVVALVLDKDRTPTMSSPGAPASKDSSAVEHRVPVAAAQVQQQPSDSVERSRTRHSVSAVSHLGTAVKRFGDDVTVMYFTPESVVMRTTGGRTEIRRISDDVTVRHFQPRTPEAPHDQ
jgi:hypothetical protein